MIDMARRLSSLCLTRSDALMVDVGARKVSELLSDVGSFRYKLRLYCFF